MKNIYVGPSPAEDYLVNYLVAIFKEVKVNNKTILRSLNIGAGKDVVIEDRLTQNKCYCICDRVDVEDCTVNHPSVSKCWQFSVESMSEISTDTYDAVFSNYVLEHVPDLRKASREIYRVLKPSGKFIATIPNVNAPEFILARYTPLWFHKLITRDRSFATHYSYKSVDNLVEIFELAGLKKVELKYFPVTELYLCKISPLLGMLGGFYDKITSSLKINKLIGSVCVIFEKPNIGK